MGGLWRKLPLRRDHGGGLAGHLRPPPLSGFLVQGRDPGALFAPRRGLRVIWAIGLLTALLTAFYMSRMIFLTFFGAPRWPRGPSSRGAAGDDGPPAVLAVLALGAG